MTDRQDPVGPPAFEMPPNTVAIVDATVAFFLLLVPGVLVTLVHQSAGEPLGRTQIGVLGLLAGFVTVTAYWLLRRRALPLELRPAWALGRYGLFMLAWLPLAFWVYPMVMRALEIPMPAQDVLAYAVSAPADGFLWVAVLCVCVAAPLGEELFFRGFLFRAIELHSHRYVALVLTTVLFALIHEHSVMLPILFLGALFGYVRMKTGGVGSSILLHIVHNTWTISVAMVAPESLNLVFDK